MEIKLDDLKRDETPCRSAADICVYKVPEDIKRMEEKAYVPEVAGLGPYHHNANASANIIQHKREACRRALKRIILQEALKVSPVSDGDVEIQPIDLEKVRQRVTNLQPQIAAVYEGDIEFKGDMFFIDACFLIEVCLTSAISNGLVDPIEWSSDVYPLFDPTKNLSGLWFSVALDFIKLENQLPFVLVREVLHLQGFDDSRFNDIFDFLFTTICPLPRCQIRQFSSVHVRHLLQWLQESVSSYIKINTTKGYNNKYGTGALIPTIEALNKVRIFVKAADQISLKKRDLGLSTILTLPELFLQSPSKTVFRNLIAFEECLNMDDKKITAYVMFLDNLINTKEDATLLRKAGVVDGLFASDQEIADVFNGLAKGCVIPHDQDFQYITQAIRRCYENSARTNLVKFFDKYCTRPWLIIGVATAMFILVCTLIQTVN